METARIKLIKLTENDFDFYFSLYGDEEVMRFISGKAFNRDEAQERFRQVSHINSTNEDTGYFKVILKEIGEPVGVVKIVMIKKHQAEIGYVLSPQYWGQGLGSEITEGLVSLAKKISKIDSLVAITDPQNLASKKILVKCGFSFEKKCVIDGLPGEIFKQYFH